MKKLFFMVCVMLTVVACNNEPGIDNGKGKLDPTAMVKIRGVEKARQNTAGQKAQVVGLTPLQVVQQTVNIQFQSNWGDNRYNKEALKMARSFSDEDRDYETPALLMWGTDIITQQGEFLKDFIYGFNVYLTLGYKGDTIGYIPDSVLINARPLIEAAYNDSNFTEVYRLFDEAFTFRPL